MHDSLAKALELLQSQHGLVPDELIKRFEYCSSNASEHVMANYVFDRLTPERDYRTALLQLYSKMQALVDLYYSESKRSRDVERKQLEIARLKKKLEGSLELTDRRLLELDVADLEDELLKIEDGRRLTKPLLDDALREVDFYLKTIETLEAGGLRPFEEAEADYFRKKALQEAKLEMLSSASGLSRSTVEQLYRLDPARIEALLPPQAQGLLAEMAEPAALPAPAGPKAEATPLLFLLLRELEHHTMVLNPIDVKAEGYAIESYVVPSLGSLHDSRIAALRHAAERGLLTVLVDGNLKLEPDFLQTMLAELGDCDVVAADACAEKYNCLDLVAKRYGFNPGVMLIRPEAANAMADFLQEATRYDGTMPAFPAGIDLTTVGLTSIRYDLDTGKSWSLIR